MSEPINDIGPQSVAESYIHKAMDILQGHRMGKVDNETASLTEEDRLDAVHWLLAAAQELLSQGHPDANWGGRPIRVKAHGSVLHAILRVELAAAG
jgi:hypothetical protein